MTAGSRLKNGIRREKKADGSVRYLARVSWQENGRQRQVAKRFRRFEDARTWKTKQEDQRHHGQRPRPATRRTLDQHFDSWLAGLTVSARTRVDYENIAKRYWRPTLGPRRLDYITTEDIRAVLADLEAKGLSPRTRQQARTILRIALGVAVDDSLLAANPATGRRLTIPQPRREMQVLTAAQVNALLDGTGDDPLHALWAILLGTGMRLGEALGLQWADVDFDRTELRVLRALIRPHQGTDWLLEAPKTGRTRAVPLLPAAVAALERHRDRQQVEKLLAGDGYQDRGFVFATATGEPLQGTVVYKYHWRPMLARLGLPPVRLHDCRHSAATMLLEAGVPLKVVQEMLGHSSITVTGDLYSHVRPAFARQAADALAAHLERAK